MCEGFFLIMAHFLWHFPMCFLSHCLNQTAPQPVWEPVNSLDCYNHRRKAEVAVAWSKAMVLCWWSFYGEAGNIPQQLNFTSCATPLTCPSVIYFSPSSPAGHCVFLQSFCDGNVRDLPLLAHLQPCTSHLAAHFPFQHNSQESSDCRKITQEWRMSISAPVLGVVWCQLPSQVVWEARLCFLFFCSTDWQESWKDQGS